MSETVLDYVTVATQVIFFFPGYSSGYAGFNRLLLENQLRILIFSPKIVQSFTPQE